MLALAKAVPFGLLDAAIGSGQLKAALQRRNHGRFAASAPFAVDSKPECRSILDPRRWEGETCWGLQSAVGLHQGLRYGYKQATIGWKAHIDMTKSAQHSAIWCAHRWSTIIIAGTKLWRSHSHHATISEEITILLIPQFCPHRPGTVPGGTVLVELAIYWLNAAVNSCSARI